MAAVVVRPGDRGARLARYLQNVRRVIPPEQVELVARERCYICTLAVLEAIRHDTRLRLGYCTTCGTLMIETAVDAARRKAKHRLAFAVLRPLEILYRRVGYSR